MRKRQAQLNAQSSWRYASITIGASCIIILTQVSKSVKLLDIFVVLCYYNSTNKCKGGFSTMDTAFETKDALELLDSLPERVGNDDEIESILADLITLKDFVSTIDEIVATLNEDVANLNKKNQGLMASNNTLYRQIGKQNEAAEEAKEAVSKIAQINDLF
jgi:hypothetical protein